MLTTTATVGGIGLHDGVLQIIGTDGRDVFHVSQHGSTIRVDTRFDAQWRDRNDDRDCNRDNDYDYEDPDEHNSGHQHYTFSAANVTSINIVGCASDDRIIVGKKVTKPTTIDGGAGDDRIWARGQSNTVIDLFGDNRIHTGRGSNTVTVGNGDNRIWTDGGADSVTVNGDGNNKIWTGSGADTVTIRGDGNNQIHAGNGDNVITIRGTGSNSIEIGNGDDTITINARGGHHGGGWGDHGDWGHDDYGHVVGNNTIDAGAGDDTISTGAGNDIVHAGRGKDTVDGGAGNDILDGGAGDDCHSGGAGKDLLIGGDGKDTLTGDAGNDILIAGFIRGLSDDDLAAILYNWVSASSYAAVTGSSGTKLITDGADRNVFSDSYADKLSGGAGQDLFLADITSDETGARPVARVIFPSPHSSKKQIRLFTSTFTE